MITRFCLYAALRNLRLFPPFFLLYLTHDVGLDYLTAGALLAYERILSGALEIPLGVLTDRFGRRRSLILAFAVAAVAFLSFWWAAATPRFALPALLVGQTLFAFSEAARSGSHKAIILDWLTREGRRDEKTRVIGLTRFWSKTSDGASALLAGVLVYLTGQFTPLFAVAAVPSLAAVFLLWSYPRSLEGSLRVNQAAGLRPPRLRAALLQAARRPGLLSIIAVSVLFESQIKLALVYLQPYLADRLAAVDLSITAGLGAIAYGVWFLIQGLAAGFSSLLAVRLEAHHGGQVAAMTWIHKVAAGALLLLGALALIGPGTLGLLGLPLFAALACLQNARRPLFVAALDDLMDGDFRATTLSAENQLRSWAFAGSALVAGALADAGGVATSLAWMAALVALAVALSRRPTRLALGPQAP